MMKKINSLMLMALVLLLYSCRSEILENNEQQASYSHTTKKTTATIKDFPEFKQFIIENQGKLHLPQSVASKNGSENNDDAKVLQIKTLKRTSYNMLYDVEESGFSILVHAIDQQQNEYSFIAKYVSTFTDKNLRVEDFTGTIYYEDINGKSLGSIEMNNGSPVQTYSSHSGTTAKVDCSYVPIVIAVRCNLAEHHLPGEAGCLATGDDMPYYTIDFQLKCTQGQGGASGLAGGDIAGGGGGTGLLLGSARIEFFLLNIPDAPYLSDEQRNFLDSNTNMIPIANRLGMYLKNNQNVQAANFVLWAVDFFKDNPNTTWSQFENWFLEVPILNNNLQNELFEDWADPNRVKPTTKFKNHAKINGIYNKIKTAANFNQYLKNFAPEGSVAHLIFDIGATESSQSQAETSEPKNYWMTIKFNQNIDWANTPKIVIAGTFMHELIHAEILRQLLAVANSNGSINEVTLLDYAKKHKHVELFNAFVKYKTNDANFQHQFMAEKYVTTIVNFLKQVYGTQYTDIEYKTVAWMSSLKDTKAWNLLPQSEKDLYTNTFNTNYWLWEL
ncbi:hypothetical protein N6B72_07995 [Chryseobacterium soli]|uniref:hypothetical protein n=1 Tax=Chryseobacterium soli TaxID=445961 RepID=UPI002953F511|nr:hypothetical protein [Chryseobacterium soli]MDV7696858.1 hypothetical protein [Chryseobacterium soli]